MPWRFLILFHLFVGSCIHRYVLWQLSVNKNIKRNSIIVKFLNAAYTISKHVQHAVNISFRNFRLSPSMASGCHVSQICIIECNYADLILLLNMNIFTLFHFNFLWISCTLLNCQDFIPAIGILFSKSQLEILLYVNFTSKYVVKSVKLPSSYNVI